MFNNSTIIMIQLLLDNPQMDMIIMEKWPIAAIFLWAIPNSR